MSIWTIELVTDGNVCNPIEVEADKVAKVNYHEVAIDGVSWFAQKELGMSFAEVSKADCDRNV